MVRPDLLDGQAAGTVWHGVAGAGTRPKAQVLISFGYLLAKIMIFIIILKSGMVSD
ncbi:hypothetical protein [Paludibacterium yongneupense]|uniref:hypothetical protein n=1 Tax=Paludibacterium yongneupense TaxID=400061 RepID=UPI0012EB9A83|nr:hypothetical protein [Paludibacterium yongneupense]